jgi:hypothetical protein
VCKLLHSFFVPLYDSKVGDTRGVPGSLAKRNEELLFKERPIGGGCFIVSEGFLQKFDEVQCVSSKRVDGVAGRLAVRPSVCKG